MRAFAWTSFLALLFVLSTPAPAASPTAAFDFLDLRVQTTGKRGAPAHSRFKSGQPFYISWYVAILKPPAHDDQLTFTFSMTPAGDEEGARLRSTAKVPAGFQDGVFRCGEASFRLTGQKPKAKKLTIKAQVMMNGVTRTRTRTITIVP